MRFKLLFVCLMLLGTVSCAPSTAATTQTSWIISVYTTPAAQPWLPDVFACAPVGSIISVADDPAAADLSIRIGEPDLLASPAYQIDTEEILVVTHRQSPVQNLTLEEVRSLFAGRGDPLVEVWVYASGDDVQRVFEQAVMADRSVTSNARLATGPQQMSDTLVDMPNTIGFLPRRWKVGNVRVVYTLEDVPVLAMLMEEPHGLMVDLIACLQQ